MNSNRGFLVAALLLASGPWANAQALRYDIDPTHTFPSFEADHMGLSVWRGKFNQSKGVVMLDKAGGSGEVDITIETDSVDFGLASMNNMAKSAQIFDAKRFEQIRYKGKLADFVDGKPTRVVGELDLHGQKRPVTLNINAFNCKPHPLFKREICGADASASLNREEFGIDAGKSYGFKMDVLLRIQVEALAEH